MRQREEDRCSRMGSVLLPQVCSGSALVHHVTVTSMGGEGWILSGRMRGMVMSIRDKLGHLAELATRHTSESGSRQRHGVATDHAMNVAQYRYLLRVASPKLLEQLHQKAFAALDPEQREHLFLRLRHDLAEDRWPASSQPGDLALAAVAAHQSDHGYLLRMLRRPRQGVTDGAIPATGSSSDVSLFAGSALGPVTATNAAEASASELLAHFKSSPEAAQVDPSLFTGPQTGIPSRHRQAALGGHDMGDGL